MSLAINSMLSSYMPRQQVKARSVAASAPDHNDKSIEETEAARAELSESVQVRYSDENVLLSELRQQYKSLRNGAVTISGKFLRDCLSDEQKRIELHDMLRVADSAYKDAEEHKNGLQWVRIDIDAEGNMTMTSSGGKVGFNAGKIARMLAAAKTPAQVQTVIGILKSDLVECRAGAAKGMCDEAEVAKVQAMIEKAMQKLGQVSGKSQDEQEEGIDTFTLSMLM